MHILPEDGVCVLDFPIWQELPGHRTEIMKITSAGWPIKGYADYTAALSAGNNISVIRSDSVIYKAPASATQKGNI